MKLTKSMQPAYAFGCSCLVLIGWLIRTKKLISWVAAIGREYLAGHTFECRCSLIEQSSASHVYATSS